MEHMSLGECLQWDKEAKCTGYSGAKKPDVVVTVKEAKTTCCGGTEMLNRQVLVEHSGWIGWLYLDREAGRTAYNGTEGFNKLGQRELVSVG